MSVLILVFVSMMMIVVDVGSALAVEGGCVSDSCFVVLVVVVVVFICVDVGGSSAGGGCDGIDYKLLFLGLNLGF